MTRFRLIAGLVGVAVVVLFILFMTGTLSSMFTAKQEARTAKGQAGASIDSGAEAMNTVSNVSAADDETDRAVKGGIDEILTQPAGHSNAAALRALCRMRQYQHLERCAALRSPDPGNAAHPSPAR